MHSLCEPLGVSSTLLGASSGRFLGLPPSIEGGRSGPAKSQKPRRRLRFKDSSRLSFEDEICEMPWNLCRLLYGV